VLAGQQILIRVRENDAHCREAELSVLPFNRALFVEFCKGLASNTHLKSLSLYGYKLDYRNALTLADAIAKNIRLIQLSFSCRELPNKALSALVLALKQNTNLQQVHCGQASDFFGEKQELIKMIYRLTARNNLIHYQGDTRKGVNSLRAWLQEHILQPFLAFANSGAMLPYPDWLLDEALIPILLVEYHRKQSLDMNTLLSILIGRDPNWKRAEIPALSQLTLGHLHQQFSTWQGARCKVTQVLIESSCTDDQLDVIDTSGVLKIHRWAWQERSDSYTPEDTESSDTDPESMLAEDERCLNHLGMN
jgi:hypothetical protein